MPRICEICGKGTEVGYQYARRGLAKYKGGVGRKTTGKTKRAGCQGTHKESTPGARPGVRLLGGRLGSIPSEMMPLKFAVAEPVHQETV